MDWFSAARGRSRGMLPLLALQVANEVYQSGRIPPVTAGLIISNTLIYLRPGPLHRLLPSINEVWFNPHLIVKYGDLKRFFLSALYHMNEPHLVFNMMSLLWKGLQLETSMGSVEFASMVAALLGLSQGITLLLARILVLFDYNTAYYDQYAVGFSGVLFALKVVLNSRRADDFTNVHGLVVPSRHSAWVELILIQLFIPRVSFLGHLGGILAGLLYLRIRGSFSGRDPLTALIRGVLGLASWPLRAARSFFGSQQPRISGRGGRVGRRNSGPATGGVWRCPTCTFDNSGWMDVCEMCSTERSGRGFLSVEPPGVPDLEEVRRRRLDRFNR